MFKELEEKDKIYKFSSPKILRLIEAVHQFKPKTQITETKFTNNENKTIPNGCIETSDSNLNQFCNDLPCSLAKPTDCNDKQNHQETQVDQKKVDVNYISNDSDNQVRNTVIKPLLEDVADNKCNMINKPAQLNCNGVPESSCISEEFTRNCQSTKENSVISECSENSSSNNNVNGNKWKSIQEDGEGTGRGGKWRGRGRGWRFQKKHFSNTRTNKSGSQDDVENLCGIIFVENPFTAKILFHLFNVSAILTLFNLNYRR